MYTDYTIIYDQDIPFFNIFENLPTSDGLGNVTGNFFIVSPNDNGFNTGANPDNVNISYEYFNSIQPMTFNLSASQLDNLEQDQDIIYDILRTGNASIPMAVPFQYSGNATYGIDYNRAVGFTILPSNTTSISDTIAIVADEIEEVSELLEVSVMDNDCIVLGDDSSLLFSINDSLLFNAPEYILEDNSIEILHRHKEDVISIETNSPDYTVSIFNTQGDVFKVYENLTFSIEIDVQEIPRGTYFIEIRNNLNSEILT